jgi:hypothetical protein
MEGFQILLAQYDVAFSDNFFVQMFCYLKLVYNFAIQSTFNLSIYRNMLMNQQVEDIKIIREMMEKSSKFQSLNGLSIVLAGFAAIVGGVAAYIYVVKEALTQGFYNSGDIRFLLIDATSVLLIAIGAISFLSWKKAKANHQALFNKVTIRAAYNLSIPLVSGAIVCIVFLLRGDVAILASMTLIFYGLGLVNASKFTFDEIHALGITEIILGLLAAIFLYNGIFFWILGFGVAHIAFGSIMYFKYELKRQ